jgi:hypothetical protein
MPINLTTAVPFGGTYLTSALPSTWSFNQTFTVASTQGWREVETDGFQTQVPIGQSGPFIVEIEGEGILCSAVEGLTVYVYQDGSTNGRGYTGSAVAHAVGVQTKPNLTVVATSTQSTEAGGDVTSVFGRSGAVTAGNADYLAVSHGGLTGAVAATRFVGGTATGHPTTGTFAVGDFVVTQDAHVIVCTTAGTPGTWTDITAGLAPKANPTFTSPANTITGALSTVVDPYAQAVLTSIIAALTTLGLALNGTT